MYYNLCAVETRLTVTLLSVIAIVNETIAINQLWRLSSVYTFFSYIQQMRRERTNLIIFNLI
jgi:hypothetical protein